MNQTSAGHLFMAVFFCLGLLIWSGGPVRAQETDVGKLQSRVNELEGRVQELEALLKRCQEAAIAKPLEEAGWQNKKNWRRLSVGMEEGQVKHILGQPSKVIQGNKTLWYYPNIYCGFVTFDEKGRLIGWTEP